MRKYSTPLDSYCYGPVDLLKIYKGDSTMWLSLRDSMGKNAEAVYRGCVYWNLDREGTRLSLVQKVSPQDLVQYPDSITMQELRKNATDVPHLLREWDEAGLSFYLHLGSNPGEEFLVAAKSLEYRENL